MNDLAKAIGYVVLLIAFMKLASVVELVLAEFKTFNQTTQKIEAKIEPALELGGKISNGVTTLSDNIKNFHLFRSPQESGAFNCAPMEIKP